MTTPTPAQVYDPLKPTIMPTILQSKQHPSYPLIKLKLDAHFLQDWPTSAGLAKYKKADFNAWTCYAFPEGDDDRMLLACELLTLDFLIDGRWPRSGWIQTRKDSV